MRRDRLNEIGKLWKEGDYPATIVINDSYQTVINQIIKSFTQSSRRSVVLTGESGVGKSTIIDAICNTLYKRNWDIFTGSASEVMAGQKYIGELEQQVRDIIEALSESKKILWVIPNFHETYYVGRTNLDPLGILDQIMPAIISGEILILGESEKRQYEKVLQKKSSLRSAVMQFQVEAMGPEKADELGHQWAQNHPNKKLWQYVDSTMIAEAGELARQYLPKQEEPGMLFDFLKAVNEHAEGAAKKEPVAYRHFVSTLSSITGFPEEMLDDQQKLALDQLEKAFNERIIGQPEAVKHLIDRIAMVKAGLTDPQRPLGVFLFVGPTGTGKTEVAKTLVDYLFSSEERMIRLDMSEFQTADDLMRITGGYGGSSDVNSLVSQVRQQPFSVILLDEFEKSHQRIWDLFLQVFDDGRLTDDQGVVVDFRNTIIILTSNTGASDRLPPRIGFGESADELALLNDSIIKSLAQTFRREFLNRIDRIICFNPLDANAVRKILKIELKKVLQRRAFRQRKWEVEWEDSAISLLMKHGFDPEMGARPMKRAIEELLLAPLAITIVNHNFPKGDQFLFVREHNGRLKVDFVDPEMPDKDWQQEAQKVASEQQKAEKTSLSQIIMDPLGKLREKEVIAKEWEDLSKSVANQQLVASKDEMMSQMGEPDFWTSDGRFEVLSDIEFIDRFMNSYGTLASTWERISDNEKPQLAYPANLLQRIANRLRLLQLSIKAYIANEYQECFLTISYSEEDMGKPRALHFFDQQVKMYRAWAKQRGMEMRPLKTVNQEMVHHYLVTGFAARQILMPESGLHVWEDSQAKKAGKEQPQKVTRYRINVDCAPCTRVSPDDKELITLLNAQATLNNPYDKKLLRSYKFGKKPLIKDHLRNWQTGKVDLILSGNFDLMGD
ncbi:MAG: AAA family ATPase [Bacteroidota bacterium]